MKQSTLEHLSSTNAVVAAASQFNVSAIPLKNVVLQLAELETDEEINTLCNLIQRYCWRVLEHNRQYSE